MSPSPYILHFLRALLLLVLSAPPGRGQEYRMTHFGVSDGLPSSEVYSVLQDRRGFMWFGTDRGAVRYDGYRFQVFTTNDGLPDNTIFEMFEDHLGRIWMGTYSIQLSYYEDGAIRDFIHNPMLAGVGFAPSVKLDLAVGQDGTVYLATQDHGMLEIGPEGDLQVRGTVGLSQCLPRAGEYLVSILGDFHALSPVSSRVAAPPGNNNLYLEFENGRHRFLQAEISRSIAHSEAVKGPDGLVVLGLGKELFCFRDGAEVWKQDCGRVITQVYTDREGRVWAGMEAGGLRVFDLQGNEVPIRLPQLAGYTVSDMLQDQAGSYWITTTQQGVFFLPSLDFRFFPFNRAHVNRVSDLLCLNDSIAYFTLENDGLFSLRSPGQGAWRLERLSRDMPGAIQLLRGQGKESLWVANRNLFALRDGALEMVPDFYISLGAKSFVQRRNGELWVGGRKGLFRYDGRDLVELNTGKQRFEVWAQYEDQSGQLWLGTLEGLYLFDDRGLPRPVHGHPGLRNRISCLDQLPDGRLVVGTLGAGLLLMDGDSVVPVNQGTGLRSNLVNCLAIDGQGVIWAGTGQGLHRIDPNAGGGPGVENFGPEAGMPFMEVQQLAVGAGKLWLAGPEGISVLDLTLAGARGPAPPVYLRSLQVSGRDTLPGPELQLDHRHNDLRFSYIGLDYRSGGPLTYRYRMEGLDKEWRYTRDTLVSYPGLAPGAYTFELAAAGSGGLWSASPVRIRVEVSPAFWQRWWFAPLLVVVSLLIAGAVAWYFIRQSQLRLRREKDLEKWKMKALRARMDPHFTFNTLNTIQAYISTHDTISAEKYLNKFARLIRLVLHQSDAEMVSLAEEMELLVLYLELEQMRFGGQFEFELRVDPRLDRENTAIPGMLVQPLAENAIKHGLLPRRGGGRVRVVFSPENGMIRCLVADNGIGREAARKLRERRTDHHRSAGLDLIRSRLELLRVVPPNTDPITIVDLRDPEGKAAGTELSFLIPTYQLN